jgi:hypothetical protein
LGVLSLVLMVVGQAAGPLVSSATANPGGGPPVFPVEVQAFGASYGEWSARWWQWLLGIAADVNPNLDDTGANCGQGQAGNVWFLAGTFGGDPVTRKCTIPSNKHQFSQSAKRHINIT